MDGPQNAVEWVAALKLMAALEGIHPQDRQRAVDDALAEAARRDKPKR